MPLTHFCSAFTKSLARSGFIKTALGLCLLAALVFVSLVLTPAEAHDRGDFLPGQPTWFQSRIEARGYAIYRLDPRASSYPGFREAIWRCYADEYAKTGVLYMEDWTVGASDTDVDLLYLMPDTWNDPGAVGVAFYTNSPAFINVNFRSGVVVWDSTVCHETGHVDGQEDLYTHPLTCDPTATYTRMSCGTYIGTLKPYDVDMVHNIYIPDVPSSWSTNKLPAGSNSFSVSYNGVRASSVGCIPFAGAAQHYALTEKDNYCGHPSIYLDNVTRVAVFVRYADNQPWTWYYYGPAPKLSQNYTTVSLPCPGWTIGGTCAGLQVAIHPESSIPATWLGGVPFLSGDLVSAHVN